MDRALKERIVGAVVLVVIAVLVVPVFLDGPTPDPETISEPVTLPGQDGSDDRRTVVLRLDRDQPLPVPSAQPGIRPVSTHSAVAGGEPPETAAAADDREASAAIAAAPEDDIQRRPEPEPEPAPQRDPPAREQSPPPAAAPSDAAAESATGMWAVQIGSFSSKENADRLAAALRAKGYAAFLSQVETDAGELHRVRIGPQKDRASAESVASMLEADDVDGQVVPHP